MRKKSLLALLLAVTLLLSGCALIENENNKAPKADTVVIRVGDITYTKADVQRYTDGYLQQQQENERAQYGVVVNDYTSAQVISETQNMVIDTLVEEAVLHAHARAMGVDPLPADEVALLDEEIANVGTMMANVYYGGIPAELTTQEEINSFLEEMYKLYGQYFYGTGYTRSMLIEARVHELVYNDVVKDVTVTDEEVAAAFADEAMAEEQTFKADINAFGNAFNTGATLAYYPAHRRVKSILFKITDADKSAMAAYKAQAAVQHQAAETAAAPVRAYGISVEDMMTKVDVTVRPDPDNAYRFVARTLTSFPVANNDKEQAVMDHVVEYAVASALEQRYTEAYEAARAAALASVQDKVDAALAELAADTAWDDVMARYTEDDGMKPGAATAVTGYAVYDGYTGREGSSAAFTAAAMALTTPGVYSDVVLDEGLGAMIMYLVGDVEEGMADLESVKSVVEASVLRQKQQTTYDAAVAQWVIDAGAVIDRDAMK